MFGNSIGEVIQCISTCYCHFELYLISYGIVLNGIYMIDIKKVPKL